MSYDITPEDFYENYRECKPGEDEVCMSLCDTTESVLDSVCTYVSAARARFASRANTHRESERRRPPVHARARARSAALVRVLPGHR